MALPNGPFITRRQQFGIKARNAQDKEDRKQDRASKKGATKTAGSKSKGDTGTAGKTNKQKAREQRATARQQRKAKARRAKRLDRGKKLILLKAAKTAKERAQDTSAGADPTQEEHQQQHEQHHQEEKNGAKRASKPNSKRNVPKAAKQSKDNKLAKAADEDKDAPLTGDVKASNKRKRTAKPDAARPKAATKPKTGKKAKPAPAEPKDSYIKVIKEILQQCKASECAEHSSPNLPDIDKSVFNLNIYYARKAVGIKIKTERLPEEAQARLQASKAKGEKAKEKSASKPAKWTHVAYFSGKTPCVHTNVALAHLYAPYLILLFP